MNRKKNEGFIYLLSGLFQNSGQRECNEKAKKEKERDTERIDSCI